MNSVKIKMFSPAEVIEPSRRVPVAADYDVVVAGGGIAGCAAAVAAARNGASVCLLEKENGLGGLATLGNVTIWLPICDGKGRQVIGGIGEELLRLSVEDLNHNNREAHFLGIPSCWQSGGDSKARQRARFQVSFNPTSYLLALEKWVGKAGVDLFYDTRLVSVLKEEDCITHAVLENKSGRLAVRGQYFVDTTGDADLCYLAGEETRALDTNVICGWFYYIVDGRLHLKPYSKPYSPKLTKQGSTGPFFRGDKGKQVSQMIILSREEIRRQIEKLRERYPNSDVEPFKVPAIPCFRTTRRLAGRSAPGEEDVHHWFEDTVAITGDWRKSGPVYAIPLSSLSGVKNHNLITAGRCISVDNSIWDCTRAIPTCSVTGEAAGTAAALNVAEMRQGVKPEVETSKIQDRIKTNGGLLDPSLVYPI